MSVATSTDVLPTAGAFEGTLLHSAPASTVELASYQPSSLVCHVRGRPLARPSPAFRHPEHATSRRPPASPLPARQHGRVLPSSFDGKGTTPATVCMLEDGESRDVFRSDGADAEESSARLRLHGEATSAATAIVPEVCSAPPTDAASDNTEKKNRQYNMFSEKQRFHTLHLCDEGYSVDEVAIIIG